MAILIPHNDAPRMITPANGKDFQLGELQALVGGYIETVPTRFRIGSSQPSDLLMVINEDGKREQLPHNGFATSMALLREGDYIVGNAVVCTRAELGDEDEDEDS